MEVGGEIDYHDYSNDSYVYVESKDADVVPPLLAPLPSLLPSKSCNTDSRHKWQTTLQLYIYSLVCAVGLVGNILVILSYACRCYMKTRKCMTMTDVYLINMAVADLVLAMALPVTIFYESNGWPGKGVAVCKLAKGAYSIKLYCSVLLLAFLSRDRYVAIIKARGSSSAMVRHRERSWVCCLLVSLVVGSLGVVLSLPTFIYIQLHQTSVDHDVAENGDLTEPAKCVIDFNVGDLATMAILVPAQISVGFFLPLLVAGFCCMRVLVALLRTKALCRHESVCVVLTVAFAMCHLPYNAALLYHATNWKKQRSCEAKMTLEMVMVVTRCVAYVHSCLYPVLYALIVCVCRRQRSASKQPSDLDDTPAQTESPQPEGPDENMSCSTTLSEGDENILHCQVLLYLRS